MFCEVIIDIAHANVDRLFTYRVPEDMPVEPGQHVLVPFGGGNRPTEGFVIRLSEAYAGAYAVKDVQRIIEPYTVLLPDQLLLAQWIQGSYNCLLVDALRLMSPAQLRGGRVREKIERSVRLTPGADADEMLRSLCDHSGKPRAGNSI